MLLCQRVLPAGLIGLVLSGMVSATSSKANTTINLAATVFAKDVYLKLLRPGASEKEQILVGRLFTLVFGVCTILVAMVIPQAGGIVEVVLSIASIAGSALFAPVIWSLYSRRQTAFSVVTVTVVALSINMFFKFISPWMLGFRLSRTWETVLGVGIPLVLLGFFEVRLRGGVRYDGMLEADKDSGTGKDLESGRDLEAHKEADRQNKFGVAVIGWAIGFTGAGILLLGVLSSGGPIVCWVGGGIALSGLYILRLAGRYGRVR